MHYSPYLGDVQVMAAKPNCPNPPCEIIMQRNTLSELDIEGINAVYGCNSKQILSIITQISTLINIRLNISVDKI